MNKKLTIFMKKKLTIIMAMIFIVAACSGINIVKSEAAENADETVSVTFKLTSIPPYTPSKDNIYVAANATNWIPNDAGYKLNENKDGTYSATIKMKKGWNVQYKFTRGNWDSVEKDMNGGEIDSRLSTVDKDTTIECKVENWAGSNGFSLEASGATWGPVARRPATYAGSARTAARAAGEVRSVVAVTPPPLRGCADCATDRRSACHFCAFCVSCVQ